ncbi:hypothetical protein SERLA73DRAFT_174026 [Serpula lacrymans var. lacrymans S7.3]|uniref:Uncharacterized protein n=1 Tax=Serpula lacrymans var. lacrymans (strain S7.3) TaxID=936435 RepID=F8PH46_SERL3|nr:hypothetical protein SERLA73DRAFT_174026 [Serpula lacrymans var. lacrymans S7.3]
MWVLALLKYLLLQKWQSGATHWKSISEKEYMEMLNNRNRKLDSGEIADTHRQTRSDKGTKRLQSPVNEHTISKRQCVDICTIEGEAPLTSSAVAIQAGGSTVPSQPPAGAIASLQKSTDCYQNSLLEDTGLLFSPNPALDQFEDILTNFDHAQGRPHDDVAQMLESQTTGTTALPNPNAVNIAARDTRDVLNINEQMGTTNTDLPSLQDLFNPGLFNDVGQPPVEWQFRNSDMSMHGAHEGPKWWQNLLDQ